jgi:hypothetical protein
MAHSAGEMQMQMRLGQRHEIVSHCLMTLASIFRVRDVVG